MDLMQKPSAAESQLMICGARRNVATLAASDLDFDIAAPLIAVPKEIPEKFLLFRFGENPLNGEAPLIYDQDSYADIMGDPSMAFNRGLLMQIDYEHQSMQAEPAGPIPAAGWVDRLMEVTGEGLYLVMREWTPRAASMIANGEYKYFSPVVYYDKKTRRICGLKNVALTNDPHMNYLIPLAARDYNPTWLSSKNKNHNTQGASEMDFLKKLIAALGLDEKTTEEQALATLSEMKQNVGKLADLTASMTAMQAELDALKGAEVVACKEVMAELGVADEKAGKDVVVAACKALKKTQPADVALIKSLTDRLAALESSRTQDKAEILLTDALASGRTTKAEVEAWGRKMASENPEVFKQVVMSRAEFSMVPLRDLNVKQPAGDVTADEAVRNVAALAGISLETVKKYGAKQ